MSVSQKELRGYYRQIKRCLPGSKKRIVADVTKAVEDYIAENPTANFTDIQDRLGTAQQIADAYVGEMTSSEISSGLRLRRRVLCIVGAVAVLIVLMWAAVVGAAWISSKDSEDGFLVVNTPVVEEMEETP